MRVEQETTFALFFGNRGFFPPGLMGAARQEMTETLSRLGYGFIIMDETATRHGAVETALEGEVFADFLKRRAGRFGGVILCLPNFGDETGAVAALQDCGVPILVQAYPDELDMMAPETRRDSFCGKFSIMDVFGQYGLPFTALKPHTVHPSDPRFASQLDLFARTCRVVGSMRRMVVGAIGARTTAFKTVRIDELALQRHGITMETLDLSDVFARMAAVSEKGDYYRSKAACLEEYTEWEGVPEEAFIQIVKLGVVLDEIVEEYQMDAIALRCWQEMQRQLGISPCVLLSEMNDRGLPAACEVDIGNAVAMRALALASGDVATCLDWNNNYGEDDNKCILFHCGPVPQSMMTARGQISDHLILANAVGKGCGWGCNSGRIAPNPFTFSSMLTEGGRLKFYLGQGQFTNDPIPANFFGCAGVALIANLQDALQKIGYAGHRHHVGVTPGTVVEPIKEAFGRYLGYDLMLV